MSFSNTTDKDRVNKILLFNTLWLSGYVCRLEVIIKDYSMQGFDRIEEFSEVSQSPLTDVDVLAWKYVPFTGTIKITAEAKGKAKNIRDKEAIFKLAGVNRILKPLTSYFIHNDLPLQKLFFFAKNLNIRLLTPNSLKQMMEKLQNLYKLNPNDLNIISPDSTALIGKAINTLKDRDAVRYDFYISDMWNHPYPFRYYIAEEGLILRIHNFNKEDMSSCILLLYAFSNYLIVVTELISQMDFCRIEDISLFLMNIVELQAGRELTESVYDSFREALKKINYAKEFNEFRNNIREYSPDVVLPGFKEIQEVLKICWINSTSLFEAIRILDLLMFSYAKDKNLCDSQKIVEKYSVFLERYSSGLFLIRSLILCFLKRKDLERFKDFAIYFNFLRERE